MSQGDLWTWTRTGEQGIEVARNERFLKLALMQDDWPFPAPPIWVLRSQCKRAPMKYFGGECAIEELEEAPL